MAHAKHLLLVAAATCLAACDGEPAPEATEISPATIPDPAATEATQRVPLQDMVGENVSGELIITPLADSAIFHVELRGAAPETTYGVRVQPGPCESPGESVMILAAVRTGALGNGASQRSIEENWRALLDGRHVVGIYAPTAEPGSNRPLACAQIPAS